MSTGVFKLLNPVGKTSHTLVRSYDINCLFDLMISKVQKVA